MDAEASGDADGWLVVKLLLSGRWVVASGWLCLELRRLQLEREWLLGGDWVLGLLYFLCEKILFAPFSSA